MNFATLVGRGPQYSFEPLDVSAMDVAIHGALLDHPRTLSDSTACMTLFRPREAEEDRPYCGGRI
jgi:hypothetical protein